MSVVCYEVTKVFPKEEHFGLTSQMRRAAVSIASNIAEGAARSSSKEFVQFLHVSLGSASELETQIEIARRNGFGEPTDLERMQSGLTSVARMLQGLIRSIRAKNHQPLRGEVD